MQKSRAFPFLVASLFPMTVTVTGCGDLQQPAVVAASKKSISAKDAVTMSRLKREIKSGFGEQNPHVASVNFVN